MSNAALPDSSAFDQADREADQLAFFDALDEGFRRASMRVEVIDRDFLIAGFRVRLRFAGSALCPVIVPALAHLETAVAGAPDLSIALFDCRSTGTRLPFLADRSVDLLRLRWWEWLAGRREIKDLHGGRIRSVFHLGPDILSLLDTAGDRAVYWVNDAASIPYYESGYPHAAQGRNEDAIACYERALAQGGRGHGSLYHHLGLAQLGTDRLAEAEQSFRHAIERKPSAGWSYQGLGEALVAQGRLEEAEQALREGIAAQHDNSWLYFHLSLAMLRQGRCRDALDLVIQACAQSPTGQLPALPIWPDWLTADLSTPERIQALRGILQQHPDATELRVFFARMLTLHGDYREATRETQRLAMAQWRREYPEHAQRADDGTPVIPAFLIIGQGKAGTTALYSYICQHPLVTPATTKEVNYWSRFHAAGDDWYSAHFMPITKASGLITGEASPQYFTNPDAPRRIAQALPNVRLILLLRDPVARSYSLYQMLVRIEREQRSWEEIVAAELDALPVCPLDTRELEAVTPAATSDPQSYLLSSAALPYLKLWLAAFPRESLLILPNAEMKRDTPGTVLRVTEFLGLPPFTPDCSTLINKGYYPRMTPAIERRLRTWFEPHQRALAAFLDEIDCDRGAKPCGGDRS